LALLATTRFILDDLEYEQERGQAPLYISLDIEEISDEVCVSLCRHDGVKGTDSQLRILGQQCGHHALTVDLAAVYLVGSRNRNDHVALSI
jgi:hypothetical protein